MSDKNKNNKRRGALPTQMNLMIHIMVGAYLMYLAYSIYGGVGEETGVKRIILALAVLVFVVTGAICVFSSLRSLGRGEYVGGAADTAGKDEQDEEMISQEITQSEETEIMKKKEEES